MDLAERLMPGIASSPDIHPMFVHFPTALFPVAFLFALLAAWRFPKLREPAYLLILFGTLGMIAAAATGLWAQNLLPHGPGSPVAVHRTIMLIAGAVAILLSILTVRELRRPSARGPTGILVGLAILNGIIVVGADRGAFVALKFRSSLAMKLPPASKPEEPSTAVAVAGGDSRRGQLLYERLGCDGCHGPDRKIEVPGLPPTLDYAGSKLQTAWIQDYLLHPRRIRWADHDRRPLLRMPDFLLTTAEAADLAAFLATRTDTVRFAAGPVEDPPLTQKDAEEGRDLIRQYACLGCHAILGKGEHHGPALDGVGLRLKPGYLYAFLMDPKGIIPRTPMKDFGFWEEEARSIAAYLITLKGPPAGPEPPEAGDTGHSHSGSPSDTGRSSQ